MHNRICLDLDVSKLVFQHQDVINSTNGAVKNMKLAYLVMPLVNKYVYLYLMQALTSVLAAVPNSWDVRRLMTACNVHVK